MLGRKVHSLTSISLFLGERTVCIYCKISDWRGLGEHNIYWPHLLGGGITVLKSCIAKQSHLLILLKSCIAFNHHPRTLKCWGPCHPCTPIISCSHQTDKCSGEPSLSSDLSNLCFVLMDGWYFLENQNSQFRKGHMVSVSGCILNPVLSMIKSVLNFVSY